jgi:pimeloyl-ACP methyl ester carboxylesterase
MITLVLMAVLLLPFLVVGGALALFLKARRRRILRWCAGLYLAVALFTVIGIGPYITARTLTHAGTRPPDLRLTESPATYGVHYEDIALETKDHVLLRGWYVPPGNRKVVVICSHGLFRNRNEVLARTMSLARLGYGVLLYDFRSHGHSERHPISLGYHERNDVLAAFDYARYRCLGTDPETRFVLMGVSMGAVATLEIAAETRGYAALILDSPFANIRQTVIDHSWLFLKMPRFPFPDLFLFWFKRMADVDVDRVDSFTALERADTVPLLLIASDGDQRIGADVSRRLFERSKSVVKEIHVFGQEVPHGAGARIHPAEYDSVVASFLARALP